jgi:hypothetical protein
MADSDFHSAAVKGQEDVQPTILATSDCNTPTVAAVTLVWWQQNI